MIGTIGDAKEGEAWLRQAARPATATTAATSDIAWWAKARELAKAQEVEAEAFVVAVQVTEAATHAEAVRQTLASGVSSLWRGPQAKLLSNEGAETLDLATTVVAMVATALGEMWGVAARQLEWANWQLVAGEWQHYESAKRSQYQQLQIF